MGYGLCRDGLTEQVGKETEAPWRMVWGASLGNTAASPHLQGDAIRRGCRSQSMRLGVADAPADPLPSESPDPV